jgi:hypothetical protein
MRVLALIAGMTAVTGAWAGEYDLALQDSDAVAAQLVFETRFGGEAGLPAARSFRLQIANEGQRLQGIAPFRAEYHQDTGRFFVNGMDVEQMLISRQEEEGGISALWGGWLPLAIVIGAASLIVVDGQDQDLTGSGASPG